ncbi:HamA C-terminal domain-containing protein [bacterium endosymbiont of Bathymodiolus sp. 5 South]|jgi:hypothetical protein|uniref:HamA C-terminal domain-containing protein n=1 Tax=bacterium endosymbiont of Bathymodiolus sp. 5 South TaxID=1181670 RepID=UPI0010BB92FA|nr:DUF1837 domain-containing protein [bacterium endosymbiont of Bathymodiolus sp. 5 South]CAC9652097.1 hypothetical protein [uncultured Gammaproteobacteria bacterium]CAC9654875.1 hypothetical protein [uncultured Gammaproteobacteria bacterium]CAC9659408.1 hypothetical protein [uncultured Gammaproteobacteria bacterium]SHN91403.1 hypothetical protein BCLUESOX_1727 [bacterium endosymbiont of Bathymodiolus sp. 5 South]SSC09100.1 hypothetical protein BTURTLESOX_2009 [bacterium endosymbiont of Bathym
MSNTIFNSESVITEHISNADLRAYFVGFDFGEYRYDSLVKKIMSAIVDFSFGFHEGILSTYTIQEIQKAACMVYKIEKFDPKNNPKHREKYSNNHITKAGELKYKNEDEFYEKKYSNRGDFGELILHLLLRDFLKTLPLVSKIFAKDSPGIPAHGFDSVHIGNSLSNPKKTSLFLGESKLLRNGETGVDELLNDIEKHFIKDFLTTPAGEFVMIGNKKRNFISLDEYTDLNTRDEYEKFIKEKDEWFKKIDGLRDGESLQKLFNSITIPLLCTYTSNVFSNRTDEAADEFKKEYKAEISTLKTRLERGLEKIKTRYKDSGEPISTNLNIVLMLFPVPSKKELVKRLHIKLYNQQNS